MKTFKLILAAALLCAAQNGLKAQTAVIGPADQYAFQWDNGSGATSLGLFFNATQNRYEFRDISGTSKFHLNPVSDRATFNTNVGIGVENPNQALMVDGNTQLGTPTGTDYAQFNAEGDLSFEGAGDYLVGSNRYAFRASANENYGLFFNASNFRYEFRDGAANPAFYIDAQTGEIVSTTNLRIGNSSTNIPGNIRFNGTDFEGFVGGSWQSLTSGGGGGGTDDQTISLAGTTLSIEDGNSIDLSAIAGVDGDWNFTGSDIYSGIGHNVGIGTSSPSYKLDVAGQTRIESDASLASGGILSLGTAGATKSINMDEWHIQSYNGGASGGTIGFNQYGGNVTMGKTNSDLTVSEGTFFVDGSANKVGIGVTAPTARLHVLGDALSTSANILSLVNYSGTVDIRGVEARSVTADGYGIGIQGTGGWRGVYGIADGGTYTGQVYGVSGTASGDVKVRQRAAR